MSKTIITVLISVGILSGCNPDRIVSYINVKNLPQVQLERVGEWPVDCQDYYLSLAHCGDYYIGLYRNILQRYSVFWNSGCRISNFAPNSQKRARGERVYFQEQDNDLQSIGCISPDSLFVALAYLNQPRIDLWKSDGQAIRTLVLPDMTGEVVDICCNNRSVFVLYEYPDDKKRRLLHIDWMGDNYYYSDLQSVSVICANKDSLITIRHTDDGVVFAKHIIVK